MSAISNSLSRFRLAGMLILCWPIPPLLCHFAGPAVGALGAAGAAALWYSQYRFPAWRERGACSFWFVVGGYAVVGVTLLFCLGRLLG